MIRDLEPNRRDRNDRGVVAIEMVLALPVLLTLIIGVVVLGNALSVKTQTMGAARDGARAEALGNELPDLEDTDFIVIQACPDRSDSNYLDSFARVQAIKPIKIRTIPFAPTTWQLDVDIRETVTMRCGG